MRVRGSRIAAFVSAARSLLVVQVLAALLAIGVTGWAFFEVRGVIAERDELRARVAELEALQGTQPQMPVDPAPLPTDPLINQILPPDSLVPPEVQPIPLPDAGAGNAQTLPPGATPPVGTPPGTTSPPGQQPPGRWPQQQQPTTQPPTRPQLDCNGADRDRPGCRPLPQRPPIEPVPDRLTPRGEPLVPPTRPQATRAPTRAPLAQTPVTRAPVTRPPATQQPVSQPPRVT